ncbi:hypothetical protein PAXRUDRAFT_19548 [Paxillus rubicundulus Ve08.2h10]|uniref:Uncharacterized protein n=1 Tax=Paxillus rubicundulus Ve08.2h10 TaxID=930991 RepID=A0A0D0CHT7_9AGAM|nr:hypothetical protein PAXRUDRAFT_19548 [Paxillus rubicundulus Ve08.2h10]
MPCISVRTELFSELEHATLLLLEHQLQASSPDSSSSNSDMSILVPSPPSPITPTLSGPEINSDTGKPDSPHDDLDSAILQLLLHGIQALTDEIAHARVLHQPVVPMMKSSQLHLLEHFANHHPHLFHQQVRVNPEIFDDILEHISDHPIFSSGGSQKTSAEAYDFAV